MCIANLDSNACIVRSNHNPRWSNFADQEEDLRRISDEWCLNVGHVFPRMRFEEFFVIELPPI